MSRFEVLLEKYKEESLNEAELQELLDLLPQHQQIAENSIMEDLRSARFNGLSTNEQQLRSLAEIKNKITSQSSASAKIIKFVNLKWIAAAAVLVIAFGIWYINQNKLQAPTGKPVLVKKSSTDVLPGGNHAILTLGDGSRILLEKANTGNIAQEGNTDIIKVDSGKLVYVSNNQETAMVFNSISTPRGGQYEVVLPDGSHVWLNAASSLRFPTAFNGNDRAVELTGEAYFEVAKNQQLPFIISVSGTKVTVLGTHFNVNAYNDEPKINTTLLEGAVKFSAGSFEKTLSPGEQSVYDNNSKKGFVRKADVKQVIAWKNGLFEFENADLKTIMRQISRWYDVDIVYAEDIGQSRYGGGISRKLNLSEVLRMLETNGVKCKIENKIVTVIKINQ